MLTGREVWVLGAGIGGLAAAIALAQRGAKVRVLEQADRVREVGAGLQISPNGVRVLDALGLAGAARGRAIRSHGVTLIDGPSGQDVARLDFSRHAQDVPYLLFHRADLIDMLADAARSAGVHIVTGARVTSVLPGKTGVGLEIDGQGSEQVPFLVGADGLHSVVRPQLNPTSPPFFTGQVAWRALVPADGQQAARAQVHMGPGRHLVTYPLRDGQILNLVAVEERSAWAEEGWFHRDDAKNLRAAFAGFCEPVQAILRRVDEVNIWGLYRHPVAAQWYKGASVLLGDAAHPTLPFMAQGAVMALEDAWVLADCLASTGLAEGPALYQARRRHRVTRVIEAANANARNYHYRNPLARFAGHTALRLASRFAPDRLLGRFDWIYRHDVTQE